MASEFVDLVSQVNGVLRAINGGTGNDSALAAGTILYQENRTGSTLPQYSTVAFTSRNIVLTTQDSQVPVLGVILGELNALTGQIIPGDVPGATSGHIAVIATAGVVGMIFDAIAAGTGDYVYTSGTNAGHVYSLTTRGAGAIGMLLSGAGFFSPPTTYLVAMWSGVSLAGPLHVTAEGASVNVESDAVDFESVLATHAFGHTTTVDIAPELLGGLVGAQVAYTYGATGTTIVRPTSDVYKSGTFFYSSGSTAWNLVNGAGAPVVPAGPHYSAVTPPTAPLIMSFGNPSLDYTYRIDSVTLTWYGNDSLAGPNTNARWRDPATGQQGSFGNNVPTNGYYNETFTTRPWDSRPWTLSDLPHLQFGPVGSSTYQVYITVNWTRIISVAEELDEAEKAEHVHVVGELWAGDGATVTFTTSNEYEPQTLAAFVAGDRTAYTEVPPDQVTFGAAPGSGAAVYFDYLARLV